ncbi:MAG: 3-hydroxyacyl-CoA dehydrogenase NAD-binding domain-containing protein [Chitinophagaceae bacterium]
MIIHSICICGAGTMGTGIAQLAAQNGFYAILYDQDTRVLDKAQMAIEQQLSLLAEKNKITADQKTQAGSSIQFVSDINFCIGDLIIEAIIEKLDAKIGLLNRLAEINHSETVFATNTSSLSVSAIAKKVVHPSRVAGMHFFNPAPVLKLVEVVRGEQTSNETIETIMALAKQLGKTPVLSKDSPGFIVNRVARHYYLEALKLVEQGAGGYETIDDILESTGFRMGPFRLMDLIGNDINLAVTESLYEAFGEPVRFKPSVIQEEKVKNGELGRKSGKGYYSY